MCTSATEEPSHFIEIFPLLRANHAGSRMMHLDSLKAVMICFKFPKIVRFCNLSPKIVPVGLQIIWLPQLSTPCHCIEIIAMTCFSSLTASSDRPMISPTGDMSLAYKYFSNTMADQISENKNLEDELKRLSDQADELIRTLKRLQADNHHLRIQQDQISAEKTELQDRNRQAKQRIDLIVERLRTLEPE